MSRWYRAYEGTVTDSKLGEVAIIAATSRSVVIATWHAILENCANVNDGGRFEITPRRVAAALVEPVSTIEQVFAGLEEVGMKAGAVVTAWTKRQYESDNSTGRSKRHREAKRNGQPTTCNGDATLQQQHATAPETETETEKKDSEPNGSGASAPPDPRTELFNRGLETLARMTGKTPSSVRSLVGKWLKACDDEAIHVLAAIDDAATDRIVDPIPWIEARLRPKAKTRTNHAQNPNRFRDALDKLRQHVGEIDRSQDGRGPPVGLLPSG